MGRRLPSSLSVFVAACAFALAGCAGPAPGVSATAGGPAPARAEAEAEVPRFSTNDPKAASALPSGWEPWIITPAKTPTVYRLERGERGLALRADADASASGLLTRLSVDPMRRPVLEWTWKVSALIPGADNADRHAEDSPVRVVLAFDGDRASLPLRERLFFEQARMVTGRDMPYATLMYIWENHKPVGTVIVNPYTTRIRKLVVASGPADLGRWNAFRRNIVEDYRAAYGADPGRLIAIAVLTDTDNTRQRCTAWYGDIRLRARPSASQPRPALPNALPASLPASLPATLPAPLPTSSPR